MVIISYRNIKTSERRTVYYTDVQKLQTDLKLIRQDPATKEFFVGDEQIISWSYDQYDEGKSVLARYRLISQEEMMNYD